MPPSKSDPIAIVGAGVFGLSAALQLSSSGYTNISVYERDTQVPARYSAGHDLNKIVRPEYEDPWYTKLTLQAIQGWKTPLFGPHFHQTGFLHLVSGTAPEKATQTLGRFYSSIRDHPTFQKHLIPINSQKDITDIAWQLNGPLPGWNGYFNRLAGYAHSSNALRAVYEAAAARGVKFFLGDDLGKVTGFVYGAGGQKVTGIRTGNGKVVPAALVIVAVGAAAATLIPDAGSQVVAKSWSIGHVKLTDDETSKLRGIPVTYARDLGFLFEPDPKTNLLKICPMGGGYINTDPADGVSYPPKSLAESDGVLPPGDEARMRRLLREALPEFADRPFVEKKLCWFADTSDSEFIVDYVPGTEGSVVLLSGDSGHLFKMFPIVGGWVGRLVEERKQGVERWRWKGGAKKGKWEGDVSWRLGETREFVDIRSPVCAKL
ncbi:sarcosine oxidase [Aspergillus ellipticus CBS 707.79]|uniref:Sarcosine oxidase n=1 Tax=Aspergillus ellipticus CBS 707.79 TaxID=1448320 RepID=A0A319CUS0_9EURO|nr:sarcosine oxidase [Aspergillus ellipticus CBS 707.79]